MSATSPQIEKISATDSIVGLSIGRLSTKTVLERARAKKNGFIFNFIKILNLPSIEQILCTVKMQIKGSFSTTIKIIINNFIGGE